MKVTSMLLLQQLQSGYFLIRPGEKQINLYPYIRRCCVHLINLVNLLPVSELCEIAVLSGEAAFYKTKST